MEKMSIHILDRVNVGKRRGKRLQDLQEDLGKNVSYKRAIYRLADSMFTIDLEAVRSSYPYAGEMHSPTKKGRQGSSFSSISDVNVSSPCFPSGLS